MEKKDYIKLLNSFLKGETTESEEAVLFNWFGSEEAKQDIFASYDGRWSSSSDELPLEMRNKILMRIKEETTMPEDITVKPEPAKRFVFRNLYRYIAVACLFLLLGMGIPFAVSNLKTDFVVIAEEGQKSTVVLPDGTRVWLNSGSQLKYNNFYGWWSRTVSLEGEGYFEVHKNKRSDFIVQADKLAIKALGTEFNVRAYKEDGEIVTTLTKGKVSVNSGTDEILLLPNEQLAYKSRSDSFSEVKSCHAERFVLWKNNELYFDCETLEDIGKTLSRLYSVEVVFTSETAGKYTFCGAISNTNLVNVLECISLTAPIQYEMKNNTIYFSDIEK